MSTVSNEIANEVTNENNNLNTEVQMNEVAEKKTRKSALDKEIELTREKIANTSDERRKAHYEEHLEFLLEDKAALEAKSKISKSDWMTKSRMRKMGDEDIKRMFNSYREEMLQRGIELD